MHLNARHILLLATPFIIALVSYFLSGSVISNIQILFPSYDEYKNPSLDKKADIYLKIESNNRDYLSILNSIYNRTNRAEWMNENFLYLKPQPKKVKKNTSLPTQRENNTTSYTLYMVFAKKKIAIINHKVVHIGESVEGAKLLYIGTDRVQLKLSKGKKWLYLFR